jgi:hypothetical protein
MDTNSTQQFNHREEVIGRISALIAQLRQETPPHGESNDTYWAVSSLKTEITEELEALLHFVTTGDDSLSF